MDFTIVTPSYRQLDWLACCIASVADQQGVTTEHIIQDAGTQGFAEFAEWMKGIWPDRPGYRRLMVSEPYRGMYDAINKGLKKGTGRICAYLNCDEQYLAGALAKVMNEFKKQAGTEILYGGFLVVDEKGGLVTAQRPVKMFWQHVATSHLPNFTCATFFRRRMLLQNQAWFDPGFRSVGDAAWTVARLRHKVSTERMEGFHAIFTERAENQGLQEAGREEAKDFRQKMPIWVRWGGPLWRWSHRLGKLILGRYQPERVSYALFQGGGSRQRNFFPETVVSPIWKSRLGL